MIERIYNEKIETYFSTDRCRSSPMSVWQYFAFVDRLASSGLLKASIAATILLPVLLYAYTLVYRLSQKKKPDDSDEDQ